MNRYLTESFLWRFCAAVYAWLRGSFLGKIGCFFRQQWMSSWTYGFFAKLLCKEPAMRNSALYRFGERSNEKLHAIGGALRRSYRNSFYARTLLPYLQRSFFLRLLLGRGVTGLLLTCIGSYAIIDYVLRDILQMGALASVWDEGLMLLCALWIVVQRMGKSKVERSRSNPVDLLVAFYILAGALLLIWTSSVYRHINITGYRASMQYLLLFFLVVRLIRDDRDFMRLYELMIAIATVLALYGIYQFIVGTEIPSNWTDMAEESVRTRVFAIFSNPNIMGAYMILFAPMAIGMAYAKKEPMAKIFYWFCGLCMCGACLFTMSRGAWLALVVAAVLFALIVDRKLFFLLLAGGLVACFLPFVRSRIGYLFTQEFRASNQRGGRGVRWARAFKYLSDYQVWPCGLGYGMYGGAVAMQNQVNLQFVYTYVDNYYVKTLAESGYLGLSALLTMLGGLLWNGARACGRSSRSSYKPLCAGMLTAMIGTLIQSFFESLWEEPYLMALFFTVAAMLIYAGFLRKPAEEKEEHL